MIDKQRLKELAGGYGIVLSPAMLERFERYSQLLDEWNEKINLTTITRPEEVEVKHFLDCLLLAARPELAGSLVDVGSGAGFPGLVVEAFRPELEVTLMEPTGKRVRFLQAVAVALDLKATVVPRRAEEAARREYREAFDTATARAVAAMPALCEYCLPLVKPGGVFIAMKGGEEPGPDDAMLAKLGGRHRETVRFSLPDGSTRSLVIVDKASPTPPQYPRNGGVIAKRPLQS